MSLPPVPDLENEFVRLVRLSPEHEAGLIEAVRDGALWRLWYTNIPAPDGMGAEIARRLALGVAGTMIPFTVIDRRSGAVAGMTTYMNIEAAHRRLEIGSTWYRVSAQGSGLNVACKRLLLGHAFEALGCVAVEFRTHFFNQRSRRAIERLGAKQDGILRAHRILEDGSLRDTVVYSIVASEWPAVRRHLYSLMRPPA